MRVRLTRKLAERVDGVDLTTRKVGEVFDLPASEASLLIAEGWADVPPEKSKRNSDASMPPNVVRVNRETFDSIFEADAPTDPRSPYEPGAASVSISRSVIRDRPPDRD